MLRSTLSPGATAPRRVTSPTPVRGDRAQGSAFLLALVLWIAAGPLVAGQYPSIVDLTLIDEGIGSEIQGVSSLEETAHSLSAGGDLNGDGVSDLAIGAHEASPGDLTLAGTVYVVFGGGALNSRFALDELDGTNGFTVSGLAPFDTLGKSVSLRGDLNNDGIDDLVLGAPFADPHGVDGAGSLYVLFGTSDGFPASFDLTTLDGTNGFAVHGASVLDQAGASIDIGPDLDGDGFDDLAIGAPGANDPVGGGFNSGEAYVLYGRSEFPAELLIADHLPENGGDGSELWVLRSGEADAEVGISVSSSADLNLDGLGDLIVGAWLSDPEGRIDAGTTYVVFGNVARNAETDLTTLDGSDGFALLGVEAGDEAGYTVGHGDVDRDGIADILVGAPKAAPEGLDEAGEAYIVFGGAASTMATIDLGDLASPTGVRVPGQEAGDENGWSVSGTEDVDGDGFCDLLIGARSVGPAKLGDAYLIYGHDAWDDTFDVGTLDGVNGTRFTGTGQTGFSLAAYADLNDDDTADLVLGAPKGDPNGLVNAGIAYLLYGPELSLTIDGQCPEAVGVHVRYAEAQTRVELYWSSALGTSEVLEGECAGTALGLESPQRVGDARTNVSGSLVVKRQLPLLFCGVYLQIVDLTTCETTDPEQIPDAVPVE